MGVPLKIYSRPKGLVWIMGGPTTILILHFGMSFPLKSIPGSLGGTPTPFCFTFFYCRLPGLLLNNRQLFTLHLAKIPPNAPKILVYDEKTRMGAVRGQTDSQSKQFADLRRSDDPNSPQNNVTRSPITHYTLDMLYINKSDYLCTDIIDNIKLLLSLL